MKIQIDGINCTNKGAELMLYAILQQIESHCPNADVIINGSMNGKELSYIQTPLNIKLPFCESFFAKKLKIQKILQKLYLPYRWCTQMATHSDIDIIFDASGFRFTDQWHLSNKRSNMFIQYFKTQSKKGAKFIFLPQAWGPIEETNTQKVIHVISDIACMIYAREKVSYEYMKKVGVESKKLLLAPDFTCLVQPHFPTKYEHLRNAVCIIPNSRMLDMASVCIDDYLEFYSSIVSCCKNEGYMVYILNHSGSSDHKICERLSQELKVEYIQELNALETKGLISSAFLVISSRYHGVANALNSSVPCLATSWSHKYKLLFEDYQQFNNVLNIDNLQESLELIKSLLNDAENNRVRKTIDEAKKIVSQEVEDMWSVIWKEVL